MYNIRYELPLVHSVPLPRSKQLTIWYVSSRDLFASLFISIDISRCFPTRFFLLITFFCVLRNFLYFVFLCSSVIPFMYHHILV